MESSLYMNAKSVQQELLELKQDMTYKRPGASLLREALPLSSTEFAGFSPSALNRFHEFLRKNRMYFRQEDVVLAGRPAVIYEGDSTNFLLDSKTHDASYQPFYATWMISAALLASSAAGLGFRQLIDIGSGDGRLAFSASVLGLQSYGVEIDPHLCELQREIISKTGGSYECICDDATTFDYSKINLAKPIFFISGLPESGEMLADAIIPKLKRIPVHGEIGVCFMGSDSIRPLARDHSLWGWGSTITKHDLSWIKTVVLPTQWTLDRPTGTPYVFMKLASQQQPRS